jgi:hypothetical protein
MDSAADCLAGDGAWMKPLGFFLRYLQRLAERREARGEPAAEDVADDDYWL